MLQHIEQYIKHTFTDTILHHHIDNPISLRITTIGILILCFIIGYKLFSNSLDEEIPEHCSHVHVHCTMSGDQIKYRVEFSPEEYSKERPQYGCELIVLRRKCYFLLKESFPEREFTVGDVKLSYKDKELKEDKLTLIELDVVSGSIINATVR